MTFEILVPGRFIEPRDPIGLNAGVEGWYRLAAVKNGQVVRECSFRVNPTPEFHNLITNLGLNGLATTAPNSLYSHFHFGTGTATPQFTDVALGARVGGMSASTTDIAGSAPDWFATLRFTGLSSIGRFGTTNLTEVGIGNSSGTRLFSRALIADANGNPVAFPINSDEQLQAQYDLRLYPPLTDAQFSDVMISGNPHDVTVRSIGIHNAAIGSGAYWAMGKGAQTNMSGTHYQWRTGDLGAMTSLSPPGSNIGGNATSTQGSYSEGSFQKTFSTSWGSTQLNSDNLSVHVILGNGMGSHQVKYDPPLSKNNEQTMILNYRISWGRR